MPGPKPQEICLSDSERVGLEQVVRRHSSEQQKVLRARIILLASQGWDNASIGRTLGVNTNTARLWRKRWVDLQAIKAEDLSVEERLEDLPRPGAPAKLTADQICQIEQLACEKPEKSGRPISQWTGREIADELMQRGVVERISPRHAARLLKKGGSSRT
jgi:putative transposase